MPKWLGAPKSSDSFSDIYDRARTLERHEKQFADSAACRKKSTMSNERPDPQVIPLRKKILTALTRIGRVGKMTLLHRASGAVSRKDTARAAALVAFPTEDSFPPSGFSVQHLAERKLSSESSLMEAVNQTGAEVDVVSSDPKVSRVVATLE